MNCERGYTVLIGLEGEGEIVMQENIADHGQANTLSIFFGAEERRK